MQVELFVKRTRVLWTSNGSGVASVAVPAQNGVLLCAEFVPGTPAPTNGYAATLKNDNGTDLLSGQGTGLSNSANNVIVGGCPINDGTTTGTVPFAVASALTLAISGAGSAKQGAVYLYMR